MRVRSSLKGETRREDLPSRCVLVPSRKGKIGVVFGEFGIHISAQPVREIPADPRSFWTPTPYFPLLPFRIAGTSGVLHETDIYLQ